MLLVILAGIILGSVYFFWWQKKKDCFWSTNMQAQKNCENLRTLENQGAKCVADGDLSCIDLLNYKFFFYLLVKKEKNDITNKICQEVLLASKKDTPTIDFANQATFCADTSQAFLDRDPKKCDNLFKDDYSKKTCKFFITGDLQYCGDSLKCKSRSALIGAFLKNDFSVCDQIEDLNSRTACVFFKRLEQNPTFTCDSIYGNQSDFFKQGLDKIYCRNAAN